MGVSSNIFLIHNFNLNPILLQQLLKNAIPKKIVIVLLTDYVFYPYTWVFILMWGCFFIFLHN